MNRRTADRKTFWPSVALALVIGVILSGGLAWAQPTVSAVANGAFEPALAPGSLAIIFGEGLTNNETCTATSTPWPNTLCQTPVMVLAEGETLPLSFAISQQITTQLSFDLVAGPATVTVKVGDDESEPFNITLQSHAPGLQHVQVGEDQLGAFLRQNGSLVSPDNPALAGEVLNLQAVGLGLTEPRVPAGSLPPPGVAAGTVDTPTLTIGEAGASALTRVRQASAVEVRFSGLSTSTVGIYEVRFVVPAFPPGTYPVTLTIGGQMSNTVNLVVGATAPAPEINSLVSAATFGADGLISPGSILTMFVTNILTSEQLGVFPATEFEGASVTVDGRAAPLFDVVPSRNQINLLAPTELMESGNAEVRVTNGEGQNATLSVELVSASPGIFRIPVASAPERNDAVVVLNNTRWFTVPDSVSEAIGLPTGCEERGVNPASFCGRPAKPGDALQIFLTGLGRATPGGNPSGDPLPTGEVAPVNGNPLFRTVDRPVVTIADLPAQVLFSGLTPGFAGLYQINVFVPDGVLGGDDIPLTVSMPNGASDTATIAIQP